MQNSQGVEFEKYDVMSFVKGEELARQIINRYNFFLLSGPMGAGKSTFVKHCLAVLGLQYAGSPTFGLVHEYTDQIIHVDLYRLNMNKLAIFELLNDYLNREITHLFIEWPTSDLEKLLPIDKTVKINFNYSC